MDEMERKRKQAAARAKADEKRIKDLRKAVKREKREKAKKLRAQNRAAIKAFKDAQKADKAAQERRDAIRKANQKKK